MNEELERRIGRNESLFREVNEAIARGLWPGEDERVVAFRCECARLECNQAVRLRLPEYERVRANPRRFVLRRGHQIRGAETVVEEHPGYLVVEKQQEAGLVAESTDPRG